MGNERDVNHLRQMTKYYCETDNCIARLGKCHFVFKTYTFKNKNRIAATSMNPPFRSLTDRWTCTKQTIVWFQLGQHPIP